MTFNDNARVGGNRARRRGAGVAIAGGGVAGLGVVVVLLLNLFTGGDFSSFLGGGAPPEQGADPGGTAIEGCETAPGPRATGCAPSCRPTASRARGSVA